MRYNPYNACILALMKPRKTRRQVALPKNVMDCGLQQAAKQNRNFNNYIETLIIEDCKKQGA